ncbi:MAG: hypothetical protein IKE16_07705 [Solobacterium sp.]|nr:hypothetical protein [Solobacterium sp.]
MADKGDILVTHIPLKDEYLRWWKDAFCEVGNISPNSSPSDDNETSIYHLLQKDEATHGILKNSTIRNYAVTKEYYDMCNSIGLEVTEPDLSIVTMLNRKSWSNEVRNHFGYAPRGITVSSIETFDACIHKMLDTYGTVLVKDSMGVSGRGILPVDSHKAAERLSLHFKKQKEEGKQIFDFVIEPYLNCTMDFSCQLHIDHDGNTIIDGYQKNTGIGFGYYSSENLRKEETDLILSSGYPTCVMNIGEEMAKTGYFGYACIDSMIADKDTVIPLLEINPRMSMGRFNLSLHRKTGKNCRLSYLEGTASGHGSAEGMLEDLEQIGILYTQNHPYGVIPLAPNTWDRAEYSINNRIRIYYAIAYDKEEDYEKLLDSWLKYCAGNICTGPIR